MSMLKIASLSGIAPYFISNTPWSNGEINHLQCHLGEIASSACLEEVMLAPKPGLVDPENCGHHQDMNFATFLKSAEALAPHWKEQARIGFREDDLEKMMRKLRAHGMFMEKNMLLATGGVNTHKGLIYALSLLLAAGAVACRARTTAPHRLCLLAAEIAGKSSLSELSDLSQRTPKRPLTHGERLFKEHGIRGIRGEVADAFPTIHQEGLPALIHVQETGGTRKDAALFALLKIMRRCEDSNVIHRGGLEYWQGEYRDSVDEALAYFDPLNPKDYFPLLRLQQQFEKRKISPGGAADLLACTLFLHDLIKLIVIIETV